MNREERTPLERWMDEHAPGTQRKRVRTGIVIPSGFLDWLGLSPPQVERIIDNSILVWIVVCEQCGREYPVLADDIVSTTSSGFLCYTCLMHEKSKK